MSICAVGSRVIVKPVIAEVTGGGIRLPDGYDGGQPMKGEVVSVSDWGDQEFDEGDTIHFDGSRAVKMGDMLAINVEDVIAVESRGADLIDTTRERLAIYAEIESERDYQDEQWGGADHDDKHTEDDWVSYIAEYADGTGRGARRDFRERMVKVAALAVAAIESHDRINGEDSEAG